MLEQLDQDVADAIPRVVRGRMGLIDRRTAFWQAHWPEVGESLAKLQSARTPALFRLIFEELFFLELGLELKRRKMRAQSGRELRDQRPGARGGEADSAVSSDERAEAGAERDCRRHEGARADAAAAAGRCGLGQDDRRVRGGGDRHRERIPGGADGADGNPGDAALPFGAADSGAARAIASCC